MRETDRPEKSQPDPRADKKVYTRPTLTEYGSVAKLTLVKGSTLVEGGQPSVKKGCL